MQRRSSGQKAAEFCGHVAAAALLFGIAIAAMWIAAIARSSFATSAPGVADALGWIEVLIACVAVGVAGLILLFGFIQCAIDGPTLDVPRTVAFAARTGMVDGLRFARDLAVLPWLGLLHALREMGGAYLRRDYDRIGRLYATLLRRRPQYRRAPRRDVPRSDIPGSDAPS